MAKVSYHFVEKSWDGLPHRCCFEYRDDPSILPATVWTRGQCGEPAPYVDIGNSRTEPIGRWTMHDSGRMFSFRDAADAFAFKIRWA